LAGQIAPDPFRPSGRGAGAAASYFPFIPLPGTPQMLWSLTQGKGAHYHWSDAIPSFSGESSDRF